MTLKGLEAERSNKFLNIFLFLSTNNGKYCSIAYIKFISDYYNPLFLTSEVRGLF